MTGSNSSITGSAHFSGPSISGRAHIGGGSLAFSVPTEMGHVVILRNNHITAFAPSEAGYIGDKVNALEMRLREKGVSLGKIDIDTRRLTVKYTVTQEVKGSFFWSKSSTQNVEVEKEVSLDGYPDLQKAFGALIDRVNQSSYQLFAQKNPQLLGDPSPLPASKPSLPQITQTADKKTADLLSGAIPLTDRDREVFIYKSAQKKEKTTKTPTGYQTLERLDAKAVRITHPQMQPFAPNSPITTGQHWMSWDEKEKGSSGFILDFQNQLLFYYDPQHRIDPKRTQQITQFMEALNRRFFAGQGEIATNVTEHYATAASPHLDPSVHSLPTSSFAQTLHFFQKSYDRENIPDFDSFVTAPAPLSFTDPLETPFH